jgi:regulatory protein
MVRRTGEKAAKPQRTAFERAVGSLSRRPLSVKALREKLKRLGYEPSDVEAAISRCLDLGYLSDAVLAGRMSRTLTSTKLYSDRLTLRHMEQAGVAPDLAQAAFSEAQASQEFPSEEERARTALRKKFRETNPARLPREKAIRFLLSRGFEWDLISSLLGSESLEG